MYQSVKSISKYPTELFPLYNRVAHAKLLQHITFLTKCTSHHQYHRFIRNPSFCPSSLFSSWLAQSNQTQVYSFGHSLCCINSILISAISPLIFYLLYLHCTNNLTFTYSLSISIKDLCKNCYTKGNSFVREKFIHRAQTEELNTKE